MEEIYITVIPKYGHAGGAFTFYGQTQESRSNCAALQHFLTNYAVSISTSKIAGVPTTGELVLASIGNAWYRAVMLVCSSAYECNVRLIDFGTEEVVPLPNIRQAVEVDPQIRQTIESCPPLAQKYVLKGLVLASDNLGENAYSIATQLLLKQTLRAQILSQAADTTVVALVCDQGLVADILVRYGIGTPPMDVPPPAARPQLPRTPKAMTATVAVSRMQHSYTSMELDASRVYNVVVSFIEQGPLKFTIQEKQAYETLNSLVDRLTKYRGFQPLRCHDSGHPCAARSATDGLVYRALVIKSEPHGPATVYYVDYGNKEQLNADKVFELPTEFLAYKLFSVRASLHGIESLRVDEDMTRRFDEITDNKTLECRVKQSYPLEVALSLDGRSILDLLLQPQPNGRSAASTPSSSSVTSDSYEKIDMNPGFIGEVFVTSPESPASFFAVRESEAESIKSFEDFINSTTHLRNLKQMPASQMTAMTPCLAAFSDNARFVRGLILEDPGEPIVSVKAVDSGKVETIPIDCIKQIKKEVISIMPAQAISCCLSGFEEKVTSREVIDEFKTLVTNKILRMSVKRQSGSKLVVELTEPANGQSISQILLAISSIERSGGSRAGRVAPSKPVGNPANLSLNKVESVYVMLVYDEGKFFAQLERLSSDDLEKMQNEMHNLYSTNFNPPLLYADVKSHIGDFAVVKFPEDQAFYRAKIVKEIAQEVEVVFIDYGNILTVDRSEVLRPISMKLWTSPPFGQLFQFESESQRISKDDLTAVLLEKSIEIQILGQDKSVVPCRLSDSPKNEGVSNAIMHFKRNAPHPKGSVFSRLGTISEEDDAPAAKKGGGPSEPAPAAAQDRYRREEKPAGNAQPVAEDSWGAPVQQPSRGGNDQRDTRPATESRGRDNRADSGRGGGKPFDKPPRFQQNQDDSWGSGGGASAQSGQRDRGNFREGGRGGQGGGRGDREGGRSNEGRRDRNDGGAAWSTGGSTASTTDAAWESSAASAVKPQNDLWATAVPAPVAAKPVLKFKPINLPLGDVKNCQIVYVASPGEFYVQLEDNIPELDQLMEELATYFGEDRPRMNDVKANTVCAAMFTDDETWYRGLTEKVEGGMATVYFVDYGNRQETPVTDVRELTPDHVKLPAQACKCSLSLVTGGVELKDELEAHMEKSLRLKVVGKDKVTRTFVVNLKEGAESINAQFGGLSAVEPFSGDLPKCTLNLGVTTTVFVSYYKAPNNFSLAELGRKAEYETMYARMNDFYRGIDEGEMALSSPVAGQIIAARFTDDNSWNRAYIETLTGQGLTVCFLDYGNVENYSGLHDLRGLHPDFATLPIRALPCKLKGVMLPDSYSPGQAEARLLARSSLEAIIYDAVAGVHPADLKSDGTDVAQALIDYGVVSKEPERAKIDVITDELAGNLVSPQTEPQIGDLVAAVFDEDGLYYRARITAIEEGMAHVLFIDYGNDSIVPVGELKMVPELVRSMSPQLEEEEVVEETTAMAGSAPVVSEPTLAAVPEVAPLDLITDALAEELEPLSSAPHIGDMVAAVFDEDGLYYRAQIMEVSDYTVSVLFLDYGNSSETATSDLRQIPQSVQDYPPQLEPEIVSADAAPEVVPDVEAPAPVAEAPAPLAEVDGEQRILDALAEELDPLKEEVKTGSVVAAIFRDDGVYYRARVKSVMGPKAFVIFIDYGNEDTTDISDMREVPVSIRDVAPLFYEEVIEPAIPISGAEDIDSLVYENSKDESLVSENAWEALRAAFEIPPAKAEAVAEGQLVACVHDGRMERARVTDLKEDEVGVSLIDIGKFTKIHPDEIFALPEAIKDIPPLFKSDARTTPVPDMEEHGVESVEVLETIASALEEELEPYKGDVAPGKRVAALFEDDGLYYRAEITHVEGEEVSVDFIDYGNAGTNKVNELKEIPVSINDLPAQYANPNLVETEGAVTPTSTNYCDPSDAVSFPTDVPQSGETETQDDAQIIANGSVAELSDEIAVANVDETVAFEGVKSPAKNAVADSDESLESADESRKNLTSHLDDTVPFEIGVETPAVEDQPTSPTCREEAFLVPDVEPINGDFSKESPVDEFSKKAVEEPKLADTTSLEDVESEVEIEAYKNAKGGRDDTEVAHKDEQVETTRGLENEIETPKLERLPNENIAVPLQALDDIDPFDKAIESVSLSNKSDSSDVGSKVMVCALHDEKGPDDRKFGSEVHESDGTLSENGFGEEGENRLVIAEQSHEESFSEDKFPAEGDDTLYEDAVGETPTKLSVSFPVVNVDDQRLVGEVESLRAGANPAPSDKLPRNLDDSDDLKNDSTAETEETQNGSDTSDVTMRMHPPGK